MGSVRTPTGVQFIERNAGIQGTSSKMEDRQPGPVASRGGGTCHKPSDNRKQRWKCSTREATAIQWHDIDFEKNYIIVRRNIPHHREVQTTKTEASQRKVDMSPELSAELKRLRMERKKQALADGKVLDAEEWVFPNEDGTPIYYTNFLRRVWHKVQDIAKVRRRTPHDLRHSWASHMLASGADLAYVSNQLGHANPSITLRIYSHWVPGMRRVMTSILDTKRANTPEIKSHPL
jgi:integrase